MVDPLTKRLVPFQSKDYDASELMTEIQNHISESIRLYEDLVKAGVDRGQAICVLPPSTYSLNLLDNVASKINLYNL